MKLLRCPKGYIGVMSKGVSIYIDVVVSGERGYALVRDDIAEDLLKKGNYEIVAPASYPGDLNKLYEQVKKYLNGESLEDLLNGVESAIVANDTDDCETSTTGSNVPTPIFIPTIWTDPSTCNWPVTITYNDSDGNANSFVFTQDYTIRPCWLCRIKYWIRNRVFRKGLKSS